MTPPFFKSICITCKGKKNYFINDFLKDMILERKEKRRMSFIDVTDTMLNEEVTEYMESRVRIKG